MYNLGNMYDSEYDNKPADYKEALKWYTLAANNGESSAQASIGSMYEHGRGVEANKQEALKWYTLSANNDNKICKQLLESLAQKKEEVVDTSKASAT